MAPRNREIQLIFFSVMCQFLKGLRRENYGHRLAVLREYPGSAAVGQFLRAILRVSHEVRKADRVFPEA